MRLVDSCQIVLRSRLDQRRYSWPLPSTLHRLRPPMQRRPREHCQAPWQERLQPWNQRLQHWLQCLLLEEMGSVSIRRRWTNFGVHSLPWKTVPERYGRAGPRLQISRHHAALCAGWPKARCRVRHMSSSSSIDTCSVCTGMLTGLPHIFRLAWLMRRRRALPVLA